ncbi:helix-turn-helix domain-containing protein [Nocardia sp. NPDC057227]|uniref:helix-turn-helix domain-containing protein n=1 Tax=Nocardia sp. NPDC057227 TaxID=3346056 RepID=UPI003624AEA3
MLFGNSGFRIRRSIGMTQAELGALLHLTQPGVSQLEHDGPASHDLRVLRRVAKALQVPLAVLAAESDEEADVRRRQFFATGAVGVGAVAAGSWPEGAREPTPSRGSVGITDVDRIMRCVDRIHELPLTAGGDRLCDIAANEVRFVEHLLERGSYSDKVVARSPVPVPK